VLRIGRQRGSTLPQERHSHEVDETSQRERTRHGEAGHRERRQRPCCRPLGSRQPRGPEETQIDHELACKPVQRREPANGSRAEGEKGRRLRQGLRQSSQLVDLRRPGHSLNRAGSEEQERLEKRMIPGVKESAPKSQKNPIRASEGPAQERQSQPHRDDADIFEAAVRKGALEIVLRQGKSYSKDRRRGSCEEHESPPPCRGSRKETGDAD